MNLNNSIKSSLGRVENDANDIESLTSETPMTLANLSSMLVTIGRNEQVMKDAMLSKNGEIGEIIVKQSEWLSETGLQHYKDKIRRRVDDLQDQINSLKTYQNNDNTDSVFRTTREQLEAIHKDHVKFSSQILAPQRALNRLLPALDQRKISVSIVQNFVACCCTYNKMMFNSQNAYVETPENSIWRFEQNKFLVIMDKYSKLPNNKNSDVFAIVKSNIEGKNSIDEKEMVKTYIPDLEENKEFGNLLNKLFTMIGLNSNFVSELYK